MKVLIVGATGLIGRQLILCLLLSGYEVRALARSPKKLTKLPEKNIYPWSVAGIDIRKTSFSASGSKRCESNFSLSTAKDLRAVPIGGNKMILFNQLIFLLDF